MVAPIRVPQSMVPSTGPPVECFQLFRVKYSHQKTGTWSSLYWGGGGLLPHGFLLSVSVMRSCFVFLLVAFLLVCHALLLSREGVGSHFN